jgi:hypothetical protein
MLGTPPPATLQVPPLGVAAPPTSEPPRRLVASGSPGPGAPQVRVPRRAPVNGRGAIFAATVGGLLLFVSFFVARTLLTTGERRAAERVWLATALACPPPATCTGKSVIHAQPVTYCVGGPKTFAVGDAVLVVNSLSGGHMLGRVSSFDGHEYGIAYPDSLVAYYTPASVVGGVCR